MKYYLVIIGLCFLIQTGLCQRAPMKPEVFMPGFISTSLPERDMAISPDGTEMFFTVSSPLSVFQTILYCKKKKSGKWSQPKVAPFCGTYSDLEPTFTVDGNRLFFSSNRPISGDKKKDFDIWMVEKINGVWGTPTNLGEPINTSADEFYPSVSSNGNLYFTAAYKEGVGQEDIFLSEFMEGRYQRPLPLDSMINSAGFEFNAFVSKDERYLIFSACGRKDGKGGCDLYLSENKNGKWTKSKNLQLVNSNRLDYCPFVSFDGLTLYFTSEVHELKQTFHARKATLKDLQDHNNSILNAKGNIYWVDFQSVLSLLERGK